MKHVCLGDEGLPQWVAISYCWGENPGIKQIILDGKKVNVPDSAEAAIKGTYRGLANPDTPIWIDAICINQLDLTEKNHQVAMMGNVYSRAAEVLVWLGDDNDESTAVAIRSLCNLVEWGEKQKGTEESKAGRSHSRNRYLTLVELLKPPFFDWSAVYTLCNSPWFSRSWAMQEVVLAQKATCFRGGCSIPW
jgi:hypothetical protein